LTLYGIVYARERFERNPMWYLSMFLSGALVTHAAILNFRHLAKSNVNPGMFAQNRTFSMGFIVENLWFQVSIVLQMTLFHPTWWHPTEGVGFAAQVLVLSFLGFWVAHRKLVFPLTSYKTWESGNEKVNEGKMSAVQIWWINVQVKVTCSRRRSCCRTFCMQATQASCHESGDGCRTSFSSTRRTTSRQPSFCRRSSFTTVCAGCDRRALFFVRLWFCTRQPSEWRPSVLRALARTDISAPTFAFLFNVTPYCGIVVYAYYFAFAGLTVEHAEFLAYAAFATSLNIFFYYPKRGNLQLVGMVDFAVSIVAQLRAFGWALALSSFFIGQIVFARVLGPPLYIWVQHCLLRKQSLRAAYPSYRKLASGDQKLIDEYLKENPKI
jgi:hypothetical protein